MGQMITLEQAQDILLNAHGKVAQVQGKMFVWACDEPCFCATGLLAYEFGVARPVYELAFDLGDGNQLGNELFSTPGMNVVDNPKGDNFIDETISKVMDALGLPDGLGWDIVHWNDSSDLSFMEIAQQLPRFWDDLKEQWIYVPRVRSKYSEGSEPLYHDSMKGLAKLAPYGQIYSDEEV